MILSDIMEANLAAAEREEYVEMRVKETLKEARKIARNEGRIEGRSEGMAEGRVEGRAEGEALGRQAKEEQIIINMYKNHLSFDLIAKYVNLSLDKVKAIVRKVQMNSDVLVK